MLPFIRSLMRRKMGAIATAVLIVGLAGGITAGAVLGSGSSGPATAPAATHEGSAPDVFIYSAKVVCVPALGKAKPALVAGKYKTAVNVHNPSGNAVNIEKWITLSPPQGQDVVTGDHMTEVLGGWEAFDVDCKHMAEDFGLDGATVPGGKGFFVIVSDGPLNVAAVYTSQRTDAVVGGVGASIDTEYIEPRIVSAGALVNGDFETGGLSPWSLASDNSSLQQGVVEYPSDPVTTNLPYSGGTYASKIRPGSQAPEAAIEQTVTVVPGASCTLDLDVAARELQAGSFDLGTVTAYLDGVAVDSHAFGVAGTTEQYANLSGSGVAGGFFMTVGIGFTRPAHSFTANPLHLLDNVSLVC